MHFNRELFSGVLEQSSFTTKFFWLKRGNRPFLKKMGFGVVFMKLKCRRQLQTGLPDLKKHQTIEILLRVGFLRSFKTLHF